MKKTIAIVACAATILLAGKANAQLGINAGYVPVTLSTAVTSGNTTSTSTSEMDGFFAGVTYNYGLSRDLGVAFGLQGRYYTKTSTGSANFVVVSGNDKSTTTQLMLDVPVLFNYSLPLGSAKLTAFAGPTFSYAVYGNTHVTSTTTILGSSSTTETDYAMYGDNSSNNRLDITAAFGLQFQYSDFRLFGGYRLGLTDLNTNENVKTTSSGLFVGLGYNL
ncbi:MAG: PorT family protein [Bacteroidales bacterium]|nr:PorT family protein [Bacteroidales bacterium]